MRYLRRFAMYLIIAAILGVILANSSFSQSNEAKYRRDMETLKRAGNEASSAEDEIRQLLKEGTLDRIWVKAAKFEGVYRTSKAVLNACEQGAALEDYRRVLLPFGTEVSILSDMVTTKQDSVMLKAYVDALRLYTAAQDVWTLNVTDRSLSSQSDELSRGMVNLCWTDASAVLTKANEAYLRCMKGGKPRPPKVHTTKPSAK